MKLEGKTIASVKVSTEGNWEEDSIGMGCLEIVLTPDEP